MTTHNHQHQHQQNQEPAPANRKAGVELRQRVSTILYGRGMGTIVAIHGEQNPASMGTVGSVRTGGRAYFDIVFDDGNRTHRLPETILHGVQWTIHDEIATPDEVEKALLFADSETERKAMEKAAEDAEFATAVAALRVDPAFAMLEQTTERTRYGSPAANIRKHLKAAFPKVKFSVRTDGSAVNIRWTDGPTAEAVDGLVQRYKAGGFDLMSDCYEYRRSAWTEVFGSTQYVFTTREYSDAMKMHACAVARTVHGVAIEDDAEAVKKYATGQLWSVPVSVGIWRADNLQSLIGWICQHTTATAGGMTTEAAR